MRAAGLHAGDEVTVRPLGDGEVIVARRGSRVRRHAGIATGIYKPAELDRLRDLQARLLTYDDDLAKVAGGS